MVTSKRELWDSLKTSRRADHAGETAPIAVQIAGVDPQEMADCARYNIDRGAQIIDINMGCPAKKVCKVWAGSALMRDEPLALRIVSAVVQACAPLGVPVTLKMRSGWSHDQRNARSLAVGAQNAGVSMVTVHGRTRDQGYGGQAEYDTVAEIKSALQIPVVCNGDIDTAAKAKEILQATGADAVMIGRAAQGRPWIFAEIAHFLAHGVLPPPPTVRQVQQWLREHLLDHYSLYGEFTGMRSARKHIGWAVKPLPGGLAFRDHMNSLQSAESQLQAFDDYFDFLADSHVRLPGCLSKEAPRANGAVPSTALYQ
jgi:tRNA-dihydrouridine synthase B